MDRAIFIPIVIWAIFVVVMVFKKTMTPASRLLPLVIFVVYAFIFKDGIISLVQLKPIPYVQLLKGSIEYVFISLAALWPTALILLQNMTESESSSMIIRLAVFSAVVFAGYLYFN